MKEDGRRGEPLRDVVVEPEFDALIPGEYIESDIERLAIYRRLYGLTTFAQLDELSEELHDRFGKFPWQVENLFGVVRLRLQAAKAGFKKVAVSESAMEIEFPPDSNTAFYEGEQFQKIMQTVSAMRGKGAMLRQHGSTLKLAISLEKYSSSKKPLEIGLEVLHLLSDDIS